MLRLDFISQISVQIGDFFMSTLKIISYKSDFDFDVNNPCDRSIQKDTTDLLPLRTT